MNQPSASSTNINTEAGPSVFSRLKGIVDSDESESDSASEKKPEKLTQHDFDVREEDINENKKKRRRVNSSSDEDDD